MYTIPGTTFDIVRKLKLTAADAAAFVGGFLPYLPDKLDDNLRGLLREGLGKLLISGVRDPVGHVDFGPLIDNLDRIPASSLNVKYATQRAVAPNVVKDMSVIAQRWDTLHRRVKVAHTLITNQRRQGISGGDNTTTNQLSPVDVYGLSSAVVSLAGGESHTCALLSTGDVKCWGDNNYGELGDGSLFKTTPVDVIGF